MNSSSLVYYSREDWEVAIETSIAIIIALFSIGGNALVFIAFYRDSSLRTTANAFIVSLAATDFLFGSTRLPMFIHTLLVGKWEFSKAVCTFQGFQGFALFSATLHTLSAISISRCCLVIFPLRYKFIFTKKTVQRIIVGIWIFSVMIASGPLFGWGLYTFDHIVLICTFDHTSSKSYHYLTNTLVLLNAAVIIICYFLILKKVRDHQKRIFSAQRADDVSTADHEVKIEAGGSENTEQQQPSEATLKREELHITRTLLIVVSLFGICWLPSAILGNLESESFTLPRWVRLFETLSIGMNSMVNPLVYGVRSPKFRRAFVYAFKCQ